MNGSCTAARISLFISGSYGFATEKSSESVCAQWLSACPLIDHTTTIGLVNIRSDSIVRIISHTKKLDSTISLSPTFTNHIYRHKVAASWYRPLYAVYSE